MHGRPLFLLQALPGTSVSTLGTLDPRFHSTHEYGTYIPLATPAPLYLATATGEWTLRNPGAIPYEETVVVAEVVA